MLTENLIKGQLIELKVQEELLRYGFDLSIPSYNASKYDLIVDTGKELLRIQVKKALGQPKGKFVIACTTQNVRSHTKAKHKYTSDEIDYFATAWKDKIYLIPVEETSNQKILYEDSDEYLAQNVLSAYARLSDEDLYNQRQRHGKHIYCISCGTEISYGSEMCLPCRNLQQRHVQRPSREELKQLIRTESFLSIGKKFGVTDTAIRKWCDHENLPRKSSVIKKFTEEEWQKL